MAKEKEKKKPASRQIEGRPKFKSKNIKIREDQNQWLRAIVAKRGGSINEIVRRMIDEAMTAASQI